LIPYRGFQTFNHAPTTSFPPTFERLLLDSSDHPIVIDGLWGIGFRPLVPDTHRSLTLAPFWETISTDAAHALQDVFGVARSHMDGYV
jgi:hypothetical protein